MPFASKDINSYYNTAKNGNLQLMTNWRDICLMSLAAKLYNGIILISVPTLDRQNWIGPALAAFFKVKSILRSPQVLINFKIHLPGHGHAQRTKSSSMDTDTLKVMVTTRHCTVIVSARSKHEKVANSEFSLYL